ncbi:MAG: hypothetical protein RLN88_16215 [Ekhidna sp.]|uniref:hypothetical protein n=1 Tax=Ekhidna sp. TaxID=2608089 RepID=UPI0032EE5E16
MQENVMISLQNTQNRVMPVFAMPGAVYDRHRGLFDTSGEVLVMHRGLSDSLEGVFDTQ